MLQALGPIFTILTPFLLLGIGGLGWLYRSEREKRRELEHRLNEKKAQIYHDYIENMTRVFTNETMLEQKKGHSKKKIFDMTIKNFEFCRNSLIYGSSEIVNLQSQYMSFMFSTSRDDEMADDEGHEFLRKHLEYISRIISAMRKELGHPKPEVTIENIGDMFITDFDDYREMMAAK